MARDTHPQLMYILGPALSSFSDTCAQSCSCLYSPGMNRGCLNKRLLPASYRRQGASASCFSVIILVLKLKINHNYSFLTFPVCVHVCISAHTYVHMRKDRGQPQTMFIWFIETGSQIYLGWLASKQALGICLSLPPQGWDSNCIQTLPPFFNVGSGARTQDPQLAEQALYWLNHLPRPASGFYLYSFFASQFTCLVRSSVHESCAGPLLSHLISI